MPDAGTEQPVAPGSLQDYVQSAAHRGNAAWRLFIPGGRSVPALNRLRG